MIAAAALSTYQIFTAPLAGTYFPLSLIASLTCAVYVTVKQEDRPLFYCAAFFVFCIMIAGLWSPDKGTWATAVLYQPLFFIGFFAARSFDKKQELALVVMIFLFLATANALLVIYFRFNPAVKMEYLQSSVIDIFRNPKRVANFSQAHPNTYDVDKSGGIFDNSNSGAAFSLLCIGCTISLYGRLKAPVFYAILIAFVAAVVASGSKSALAIIFAGTMISVALNMFRNNRRWEFLILTTFAIAAILAMPSRNIMESFSHTAIGAQTVKTSTFRASLWAIGATLFKAHPILGLGFGGWPLAIAPIASFYGVDPTWPPHNSLISAWADTGLFGLGSLLAVYVLIMRALIKSLMRAASPTRATGAIFALVCVGAMSLGDPFPLLGSSNMAFPLGCLVAWGLMSSTSGTSRARSRASTPRQESA